MKVTSICSWLFVLEDSFSSFKKQRDGLVSRLHLIIMEISRTILRQYCRSETLVVANDTPGCFHKTGVSEGLS